MRESIEFSAYAHRIKIIGGPQDDKIMARVLRELASLLEIQGKEITSDKELEDDKILFCEHANEITIPAMFCEHANENPSKCTCPNNCYCKSNTCENKI